MRYCQYSGNMKQNVITEKKKKNLRDHLTQIAHFTSKKMKAKTEDLAI